MELLHWATEAVGLPDWSFPKFRETEMEMLYTVRSKLPCRSLVRRKAMQNPV